MKHLLLLTTWFYLANSVLSNSATDETISVQCYIGGTTSSVECYSSTESLPTDCQDESMLVTCSSLDNAFDVVANAPSNLTLNVTLNASTYVLTRAHTISDAFEVSLQSLQPTTIDCHGTEAGVLFNSTRALTMQCVTWKECGFSAPTNDTELISHGAVIAYLPVTVRVNTSAFTNSTSSGMVLIAAGSYETPDQSFVFQDASFVGNGGYDVVKGGGLVVDIVDSSSNVEFRCGNCSFDSNTAQFGGGVYLRTKFTSEEDCSRITHSFVDSLFTANTATVRGGAVHLSGSPSSFDNCSFVSNEVMEHGSGGALHVVLVEEIRRSFCHNETTINFTSCLWVENKGKSSSAIKLENLLPIKPPSEVPQVYFTDSVFVKNAIFPRTDEAVIQCIAYLEGISAAMDNVTMCNNTGSALCANSALLFMQGNVSFNFNVGYYGGAMAMMKDSLVVLSCFVSLNFTENIASYGGAIYQFENNTSYDLQDSCLFHFDTCDDATISLVFRNNIARVSGDSLFFNYPTSTCFNELQNQYTSFYPSCMEQFSSPAVSIIFLPPTVVNDTITIILGQPITLEAAIVDYFDQPTFAFVSILFSHENDSDIYTRNSYYPSGFTSFSLQNGTNTLALTVAGPEIEHGDNVSSYLMTFSTVQQQPQVDVSVHFVLKPCPLGFVYDHNAEACTCSYLASGNLGCYIESGFACVPYGYWYGNVSGINSVSICTSGYCSTLHSDCIPCANQILNVTCQLPGSEADECTGNRAGILCTNCSANYSFTFGAKNCVSSSTCADAYGAIIIALMVLSDLFLIAFLFVLLRFDYSLHSGTLFCFIYYFSIINTILPAYNIPDGLKVIVSVIKSFTQLDSNYLGHIPICLSTGLNSPLLLLAFLYVNPILISMFVLTIVLLLRWCPNVSCGDNTATRAISLLLLLSFTSLTETSFLILQPLVFSGNSQSVYVYVEPSTLYLNPEMHLWLFIIALILVSFFIIPFTLFLLLTPCLVRYVNLIKFKPLLDEFQGSYKDEYRWMAGFYFLCRLVYLTILIVPNSYFLAIEYALQFVSVGVLTLHAALQPYKAYWLNLVDLLLLVDIAVVSLFNGITGDFFFAEGSGVSSYRTTAMYVLVLGPLLYALVIVVLGVVQYPCLMVKLKSLHCKLRSKVARVTTSSVTLSQSFSNPNNESFSAKEDRGYREPLLGLLSSDDPAECYVHIHTSPHNFPNQSLQRSTKSSRDSSRSATTVASCNSQNWQDEAITDNESDL